MVMVSAWGEDYWMSYPPKPNKAPKDWKPDWTVNALFLYQWSGMSGMTDMSEISEMMQLNKTVEEDESEKAPARGRQRRGNGISIPIPFP